MTGGQLGVVGGVRIADGGDAALFLSQLGSLSSGVLQIAVSGGVVTPSTFVATATRIPFGSGVNGGLTDSAALTFGSLQLKVTGTTTSAGEILLENLNNSTPTSQARLHTSVGGASGGDPVLMMTIGGVVDCTFGLDNSINDQLTFSASASLGTSNLFVWTLDGRFFGTALHNNAGSMTGTANQYIGSGTYTPTLTAVTNVAASTARKCQWIRCGNVVYVSGSCDIDPTAAVATELGVSLPIASNLALATDLGGSAAAPGITAPNAASAAVVGDAANDRASIKWTAVDVTNQTWSFSFAYEVL